MTVNATVPTSLELEVARPAVVAVNGVSPYGAKGAPRCGRCEQQARVRDAWGESEVFGVQAMKRRRVEGHDEPRGPTVAITEGAAGGSAALASAVMEIIGRVFLVTVEVDGGGSIKVRRGLERVEVGAGAFPIGRAHGLPIGLRNAYNRFTASSGCTPSALAQRGLFLPIHRKLPARTLRPNKGCRQPSYCVRDGFFLYT